MLYVFPTKLCRTISNLLKASKHGNEPSRGAKVDAELKEEEEAILAKKKGKTDSIPGKQMPPHTGKTAQKQELDEAAHEERKAHSKSGANTGQQGMETIPRKN